jgi:hypothetical protein
MALNSSVLFGHRLHGEGGSGDVKDAGFVDGSGFDFGGLSSLSAPVNAAPLAPDLPLQSAAVPDSSADDLGQLNLLDDDGNLSPVQSNSGGGGSTSTTSHASAAAPAATLVGAVGGLQFNLIWDSSVSSAPAGFQTAAITAATLYSNLYSNHEVINVHVGYGEIDGYSLSAGALAESMSYGYLENYTQVTSALKKDASSSSWQKTADANLPSSDPTKGGSFFVSTAEAKALGQVSGSGTGIDGYIGLSNVYAFDYTPNTKPSSSQYDAIGAFEHELSEIMGRVGSLGSIFGRNIYTPLDLFRYSSAGVHDLTPGAGYFSVDNGKTNLGTYNNPKNGGDASDWIPTLAGDSYGSGYRGVSAVVSPTDIIENSVLGYTMTPVAVSQTKTPGLA